MNKPTVRDLREHRFQATTAYELAPFERLSLAEQNALPALARDPDGFGILRPCGNNRLRAKSASRDLALLWYTLQTPGPLPRFVTDRLGGLSHQIIGALVLDGVLAIEADGVLLTGQAASALICGRPEERRAHGTLAALSRRALAAGVSVEMQDAGALSSWLYQYNQVPASPRWRRLLPHRSAVREFLGLSRGIAAPILHKGWKALADTPDARWIGWHSHQPPHKTNHSLTYKLYVSPACDHIQDALQAAILTAAHSRAFHLKVGATLSGLLRPDKLVLYFSSFADLQEAAAELLERLESCPAHGIPFTAEISKTGLLSWGIDPPAELFSGAEAIRESFRSRVTNKLAASLLITRQSANSCEAAVSFALDRLLVEGIDPDTFAPTRGLIWTEERIEAIGA